MTPGPGTLAPGFTRRHLPEIGFVAASIIWAAVIVDTGDVTWPLAVWTGTALAPMSLRERKRRAERRPSPSGARGVIVGPRPVCEECRGAAPNALNSAAQARGRAPVSSLRPDRDPRRTPRPAGREPDAADLRRQGVGVESRLRLGAVVVAEPDGQPVLLRSVTASGERRCRSETLAAGSVPGRDGDELVGEEHAVLDVVALGDPPQRGRAVEAPTDPGTPVSAQHPRGG